MQVLVFAAANLDVNYDRPQICMAFNEIVATSRDYIVFRRYNNRRGISQRNHRILKFIMRRDMILQMSTGDEATEAWQSDFHLLLREAPVREPVARNL